MKFEELKNNLKNQIDSAYLIFGSDIFLKQKAQELIANAVVFENRELNYLVFSTDNLEVDKVIDACNTMPFFADKKIVLIKEYEKKSSDALIKRLEQYLQAPNLSTCLVMVSHEGSTYFDPLKKHLQLVDCSPLSEKMLGQLIDVELKKHSRTIDFVAKQLLIDYCSKDFSRINTELLKLINYCEPTKPIDVEAIKEHITKDLDFQIFELTEAIGNKKKEEALLILKTLLLQKNSASATLAGIYRHFRRLFYISINVAMSSYQLAQALEVKEFAVRKSMEQSKKYGAIKLKNINELCLEIDYKAKSGKLEGQAGVEFLVLTILDM